MGEFWLRSAVFALLLLLASGGVAAAEEEACRDFSLLLELDDPRDEVDDGFGVSVAIDGNVVVVGVPRDRLLGHATGRVVVYELGPVGWELTAYLRSDLPRSLSDFGNAVAVQGDLIAVGSLQDDEAITDGGAVHLFRRMPDGSWPHVQRLHPLDPQWAAQFGWSVALDEGRLAVGCMSCVTDAEPLIASGTACVFEDDGTGQFVERAVVAAADVQVRAGFGYSVALDEDLLVVGEPGWDERSDDRVGRVHVFSGMADGSWVLDAELLPPSRQDWDESGLAVKIEDGVVAVGSDGPDSLLRIWRRMAPGDWSLDAELRSHPSYATIGRSAVRLADGLLAVVASRRRDDLAASEPLIAAWLASVSATDSCNELEIEHDAPAFFFPGCPPGVSTTAAFVARDACGNESRAESALTLVDSTPPVVTPGDGVFTELWAPNHRWVEIAAESLTSSILDACDPLPPEWRIASCTSDEPADERGDGRTEPDCLVAADGLSLSARSERSGRGGGRSYELAIVAGDACGNWSLPVPIGSVLVRHDHGR